MRLANHLEELLNQVAVKMKRTNHNAKMRENIRTRRKQSSFVYITKRERLPFFLNSCPDQRFFHAKKYHLIEVKEIIEPNNRVNATFCSRYRSQQSRLKSDTILQINLDIKKQLCFKLDL